MAVPYPVCECSACGSPIQGPMVLIPTGVERGEYIAEHTVAEMMANTGDT